MLKKKVQKVQCHLIKKIKDWCAMMVLSHCSDDQDLKISELVCGSNVVQIVLSIYVNNNELEWISVFDCWQISFFLPIFSIRPIKQAEMGAAPQVEPVKKIAIEN